MERKLKRFNILLDDESLLYFPGSFLTGKVLLELEENTPATGLYFHIVGEGVVRLGADGSKKTGSSKKQSTSATLINETHNNNNNSKQAKGIATDREHYIDFRMRLLGDESGGRKLRDEAHSVDSVISRDKTTNSVHSSSSASSSSCSNDDEDEDDQLTGHRKKVMILSPGVHTFPFKLGLPPNLPSTFLGLHGWVQYYCRAVLKEPSGLVHKNQQVFIIINPIDLNEEPASLQQPFYCETEQGVKANRCTSGGSISARLKLDRGGFVPGENILVSASIENESKQSIRRMRAVLTETVEYRAQSKLLQAETRELACLERGKLGPHSSAEWKREPLHIPALPPTNLRGCQLIKIHYDVDFQIFIKNSKKPVRLSLPIVMATYPIRNKDGTLKRRKGASYPQNLPILRPWMDQAHGKQPISHH